MKKSIYLLSCLGISCFIPAMAGQINLTNDNDKPLDIVITPEGNALTEKKLVKLTKQVPAKGKLEVNLTEADLGGKKIFSLEGDTTNPLTLSDTCKNMSVVMDYDIVFTNDLVGSTCVEKERPSKEG